MYNSLTDAYIKEIPMSCAVSLIALGLGYLVYLHASKEKEGVKLLGQVIGIFVMIASVLCLMGSAAKCARKDGCPFSGKAPMCPMSAKMEHHEDKE